MHLMRSYVLFLETTQKTKVMFKHNLTIDDFRAIIEDTVINNIRHKFYKHTVAKAKFYRQILTGDDQAELLIQYKPEETKDQQNQRIALTNTRTKYAAGKVWGVFDKVKRMDSMVDVIEYEDKKTGEDKVKEIRSRIDDFYESASLKKYLDDAYQYYNFYDPNGFFIVDFVNYDMLTKDVWTHPLSVSSTEAVNYKYENGELIWLVIKQAIDLPLKKETEVGYKWSLYAPNWCITIEQLPKEYTEEYLAERQDVPNSTVVSMKLEGGETTYVLYNVYETKSKIMPAMRYGYIKDPTTNLQTCVSVLDKAGHIFLDLIYTKSEYDISKALHGFIQKFAFADACDFKITNDEGFDKCESGKMFKSHQECPSCKGLGYKIHKSVQDVLLVKMPKLDDQEGAHYVKLSDMIHYQQIPDNIIRMYKEDLNELTHDVMKACFNSNSFEAPKIEETATKVNVEQDAISTGLSDYSDHQCDLYVLGVRITAIHLLNDEGLTVKYKYSSDWRLETIDQLLERRKSAKEAGVQKEVIDQIDAAILKKQYSDDGMILLKSEVQGRWMPFRGKNESDIAMILSELDQTDFERVLWTYFDRIFIEIEIEKPEFYEMSYDGQKLLIQKKVDEYVKVIEERKAKQPTLFLGKDVEDEMGGSGEGE
jgi:hypothetical protein